MRVETAKKWQKRVRRWKRSGKTAEEFAEGEGVSSNSLTWWSWRLRKAEREGMASFGKADFASAEDEEASKGEGQPDRSGLQVDADGTLLRFLPARLRQEVIPSAVGITASAPLEIHLANGRVVLARPGVDPDWLSEMLAVIERPGAWIGGC